jgi:uncharacterized protein
LTCLAGAPGLESGNVLPSDQVKAGEAARIVVPIDQCHAADLDAMYADSEHDYVNAHKWISLSAAQGYENGIKNRDALDRRMTPAEIAEGQKLAREWKPPR